MENLTIKQQLRLLTDYLQTDYKGLINMYNQVNINKYRYETIIQALNSNTIKYQVVQNILNSVGFSLAIIDNNNKIFYPLQTEYK